MSLIEINADFSRLAKAAERIADALERAYPPKKVSSGKADDDALTYFDPEKEWQREQEEERKKLSGNAPQPPEP